MRITDVRKQKNALYEIWLDEIPVGEIDRDTWELSFLKIGGELSRKEYDRLAELSAQNRAKSYALYLLGRQSFSEKGLLDRVSAKHGAAAGRLAVERMKELGLLDDWDYARRCAHDLIFLKKFSACRAKQELIHRGITAALAEAVLEELSPDPVAQITELLEGKFARNLQDEKGKRRTVASLQRLGFRWEHIKTALYAIGKVEQYDL